MNFQDFGIEASVRMNKHGKSEGNGRDILCSTSINTCPTTIYGFEMRRCRIIVGKSASEKLDKFDWMVGSQVMFTLLGKRKPARWN
jgi:hypothetical protein